MTTQVIHIKNSTKSEDEIYIGRAGKGRTGLFGNPVVINQKCPICANHHPDRGSTLPCYEVYLVHRLATDEVFAVAFSKLKDKILVCFCKPNYPCHGDIMAHKLDTEY